MKTRIMVALWVVLAISIAITQGKSDSQGSSLTTPTSSTGLSRTVLLGATPAAASDQSLQLARIVIDPGISLAVHEHPGTQLAFIESGDLTYHVVTGSASVQRAAVDGAAAVVETLPADGQTVLKPGDAVIETEGMLHYGENLGASPVVILTASLFAAGMPASIPAASPAP
jgi:mannose-6-phosphate isomerase-like protein (cupin superfamily)